MIQCHLNAQDGTYKPRSGHGWYMGSQQTLKAAVGPCINRVKLPYQRMGSVQRGVCLEAALHIVGVPACKASRVRPQTIQNATPFPPPPTVALGGPLRNFPYFFNLNDNQPEGN